MKNKPGRVKIIIVHPADPMESRADGIATFIKGFIRYAPEDFSVSFVGVTSNPSPHKARKWTELEYGGKKFDFYPLFYEKHGNIKKRVPLSLRFTAALIKERLYFEGAVLFFHRIEPAAAFSRSTLPKVAVVHNDITQQMSKKGSEVLWSRIPYMYFLFEGRVLRLLDYIFTVSTNSLEFYKKRYISLKDKISFIPTWVDNSVFGPASTPECLRLRKNLAHQYQGLKISKKWVLFAGRLQEQKNPLRLIDVFNLYCNSNKNTPQLIIAGDGNLKGALVSSIRKSGLQDKVFLLSSLEQKELSRVYKMCDAFLLTSNYEGMPMCVLEALGTGIPVVTTDVGEVRQVVKNGFSGEVSETFLPEDIASALGKVLDSPEIYTSENCLNSVERYAPRRVLAPIYEKMRKLDGMFFPGTAC